MPYNTLSIANAILNFGFINNVKISPLKLQKLLYFANGYFLAAYDEPLIDRAFEAWDYGPVVPAVYREFKEFRSDEILRFASEYDRENDEYTPVPLPASDSRLDRVLEFVWETYGSLSGLQLSDLTHRPDSPWDKTRNENKGIKDADITADKLKEYFSKFVKKQS